MHCARKAIIQQLKQAVERELPPAARPLFKQLLDLLSEEPSQDAQTAIDQQQWLQSVLDRLPIGLILIEPKTGEVKFSNAAIQALIGMPVTDSNSKEAAALTQTFDSSGTALAPHETPAERAARGEILKQEHFVLRSPAGTYDAAASTDMIPAANGHDATAILLLQDITNMKRVERALLASEECYRLATLATYEAIWDWDISTQEVRWNEALCTELGHPEAARHSDAEWWYRHIHPEDRERVISSIHNLLNSQELIWQEEYRFLKGDDTYAWVKDRGYIKRDASGKSVRMIGAMQDVTRETEASQRLRESEADFRELTEAIPQMVFVADPAGNITYFNQQWFNYVGYNFAQTKAWGWRDLPIHHPDDLEHTVATWKRSLSTGEPYQMEYRLRRHDGVYRWHLGRANLIRDAKGQPLKWLGTNTDIHAQRTLAQQFEMAVAAARLGFWEYHINEDICIWNEQLRLHFGFPEGKYQGSLQDVFGKIHPEDRALVRQILTESQAEYKPYNIEFRVVKAPNNVHWLECQGEYYSAPSGGAVRMTGTALDITERKLAAQQLHIAKEEAESASRMKSAFLANMSHEIRTPLSAILGYSELLRDRTLADTEREHYIDTINRAGAALTGIIDDILDLSKVEAGKLETESVPLKLRDILSDVVDLFAEHAKSKGIYLRLIVNEHVPTAIFSDPTRVRQIVVNLISNALKFTEKGGVSVESSVEDINSDQVITVIKVRDTGIGVDEAQKIRLFQPFTQIDESTTRKHGGTGLGLALSKRLAHALGGDIFLENSVPGHGSIFVFRCLSKVVDSQHPFEPSIASVGHEQSLTGIRVLLAEDSLDNQILVSKLLSKHGASVETVTNGVDALRIAMAQDFDVVLMDIQMPQLDGYAATKALRSAGYRKPIIALTAHAMLEEQHKTREAGCDAHLIKPLNVSSLIAHVAHYAKI